VNDNISPITFNSLMRNMLTPDYPAHIVKALNLISSWLPQTFRSDGIDMPYWEVMREDPELLFSKLSWLESYVALLPSETPPPSQPEAAVITLGEVDVTGAMRLSVDYSLIFAKEHCRRVWIISDCWIPCDVIEYSDHIRAMVDNGISLRFMLVTPWGWMEIPVSALAGRSIRGSSNSDNGRGRGRRRNEDD